MFPSRFSSFILFFPHFFSFLLILSYVRGESCTMLTSIKKCFRQDRHAELVNYPFKYPIFFFKLKTKYLMPFKLFSIYTQKSETRGCMTVLHHIFQSQFSINFCKNTKVLCFPSRQLQCTSVLRFRESRKQIHVGGTFLLCTLYSDNSYPHIYYMQITIKQLHNFFLSKLNMNIFF